MICLQSTLAFSVLSNHVLLSTWHLPGPVPGKGHCRDSQSGLRSSFPISLRGTWEGCNHSLGPGTEASRREPASAHSPECQPRGFWAGWE